MQTRHGRQYWPLDPDPAEVCVEDIAAHLSKICRYNGACTQFYSVAEHSVYVSYLVPGVLARHGLLHDAPEAYCQDIVRPLKQHLTGYAEIELLNAEAIAAALGLDRLGSDEKLSIKNADNAMLLAEQAAIMAEPPELWAPLVVPERQMMHAGAIMQGRAGREMGPAEAERLFLDRYDELS